MKKTKTIDKQKIKEIVKTYPQKLTCYPRGRFEEQLENHLRKYFDFEVKKRQEETKVKDKKK